jgi:hypothetical protein
MAVIEAIATTYLEADATTVTFSSLGSYEHLQVVMSTKTTRAAGTYGMHDEPTLRFNSRSGANDYAYHTMQGLISAANVITAATATKMNFAVTTTTNTSDMATYGVAVLDILDYRNTSKNTSVLCHNGAATSVSATYIPAVRVTSGLYYGGTSGVGTEAITSISFISGASADYARGSVFTLYGLNSAN